MILIKAIKSFIKIKLILMYKQEMGNVSVRTI